MRVKGKVSLEMDMNEYRHLGNFLVRIAAEAEQGIEKKWCSRSDELNYKEAILFMDMLGISDSELPNHEEAIEEEEEDQKWTEEPDCAADVFLSQS